MLCATLELDVNHIPSWRVLLSFLASMVRKLSVQSAGAGEYTNGVEVRVGPVSSRALVNSWQKGTDSLVPRCVYRREQEMEVRVVVSLFER